MMPTDREITQHSSAPAAPPPTLLENARMAWPPARWEPIPVGRASSDPARFGGATVREIVEMTVLTLLMSAVIQLVVQSREVEGASMEPNFHTGERVLVNRLAYQGFREPQRGDVIVFHAWHSAGDEDYIKRVVGLPGDVVEIHEGGVYINGSRYAEPYLDQSTQSSLGPTVVPDDTYFVLGDNRGNSSDSRLFGPLPVERIVGRAWLRYWPPDVAGPVAEPDMLAAPIGGDSFR